MTKEKDVEAKIQVYINECDTTLIKEIFNGHSNYVFRHTDCPLVFNTDGKSLYALDMDEPDVDVLSKYGIPHLMYVYNNFQEFIDEYKRVEEILGHELFVKVWDNTDSQSIRQLELEFFKYKKKM